METRDYWIGPHGMRVPNKIKTVLAEDCCNTLYDDGSTTEKGSNIVPLTKERYLAACAEKRDDGFYWYKEDDSESQYINIVMDAIQNKPLSPINQFVVMLNSGTKGSRAVFQTSKAPANPTDYWIGPHGMLVPNTIKAVMDEDWCNTLYADGGVTEKGSNIVPLTKEEYLAEYAEKRADGLYYFRQEATPTCQSGETWSWGDNLEPLEATIEQFKNKESVTRGDLKVFPVSKFT